MTRMLSPGVISRVWPCVCRMLLIVSLLCAPLLAVAQVVAPTEWDPTVLQTPDKYIVDTFQVGDRTAMVIAVPGRPPTNFRMPAAQIPKDAAGVKILPNVPAFDWCYGCSPTTMAMAAGYYDGIGYDNMYSGPANGGVCPQTNATWGAGESPLSATHQGYDGRTTRGHVDDYWVAYQDTGPDPYITNGWTEHTLGDCTADYMGTNQSKYGRKDGETYFTWWLNGRPTYDWPDSPGFRDGSHGMRLFAESRGYVVTTNYTQLIAGYNGNTLGYTYADFIASIDAGRPVLIHVSGHSMLGMGYDTTRNVVYLHDTWDFLTHEMVWGGSYAGMQHYGMTAIELAPLAGYQPDLMIRNDAATAYIGDGVYNLIADQTAQQSVVLGTKAVYALKLQNDGTAADSFTVTGDGDATGWSVRYFDALTGGTDITTQVTGAGWPVNTLAVGAVKEFRVEVTPDATLGENVSYNVQVAASSAGDATKGDAVQATTTTVLPVFRSDMQIRALTDTTYLGDNCYNDLPPQTVNLKTPGTTKACYAMKVENDGNTTDCITVNGPASTGGWVFRYFDAPTGGTDITAQVTNGGYPVRDLAPGASKELCVEVTPTSRVAYNRPQALEITGTCGGDTAKTDCVCATTTRVKPLCGVGFALSPKCLITRVGKTVTLTATPSGGAYVNCAIKCRIADGRTVRDYVVASGAGSMQCTYQLPRTGIYYFWAEACESGTTQTYQSLPIPITAIPL